MFVDICIPKDNEEQFLDVASKLGTKAILFLYEKPPKKNFESKDIKVFTGIITEKNVSGKGTVFGRAELHNIENKNILFLHSPELLEDKDHTHYRRSGLNHVLMKKIVEKEKILVVSFENFLCEKKELLLGRLKQNLMLAKKYDAKIVVASFASKPENLRAESDLKSLIKVFGSEQQAKNSVSLLEKELEK